MWIGSKHTESSRPLGISWPNKPLRFLGVYVGYDEEACNALNFESRIHKCRQIIGMWQRRNLTFQGRIQIIKTFIISQFLFTTSAIVIPDKYIKEINAMMFKFIWKGKRERIKRSILHKDIEHGGLSVPDFSLMVKAARVAWFKKYTMEVEHVWKLTFESFIDKCDIDLNVLTQSNYDIKWLLSKKNKPNIPPFYAEVLSEWSKIGNTSPVGKEHFVWYNKNVVIEGGPIFYKEFYERGIRQFGDLYDKNNKLIPFTTWVHKGMSPSHFMKWAGLVSAVKKNLKTDTTLNICETTPECLCW